jgi:hypothetical protein
MITRFNPAVPYALLGAITVILLGMAFLIVSIVDGIPRSDDTVPLLLGNRPEVISHLTDGQGDPQPFSFLVVGDTRTSNTFEHFYESEALDLTPDFGVILGDFIADPELNRHRFFMDEFSEWGMTFPFFLIPGNHDIVTRHTREPGRLTDPFLQQDFERIYGPTDFSFVYRGCLFIGLNDLYGTGYIDYARNVLSHRPGDIRMTFVLMHVPPLALSPMISSRGVKGEKEFINLMEIYDVDYVIMGDFHSYFRGDRNHTKYIITGGGGGALYEGTTRSFHHVILLMVDPRNRQVDEIVYPIKEVMDLGDDIEIVMMCQVYPFFEGHPIVWVVILCIVTVFLGGLYAFIIVRTIRKRRHPSPPRA